MVGETDDAVFAPPVAIVLETIVAQAHEFSRVSFAVFKHSLLPWFAARTVGLEKGCCGNRFSHEITLSALDDLVPADVIVRLIGVGLRTVLLPPPRLVRADSVTIFAKQRGVGGLANVVQHGDGCLHWGRLSRRRKFERIVHIM